MPTPTDYAYSVADDTENGSIILARLDEEIRESDIVIALDGLSLEGDVLTAAFKDVLSVDDATLLDDLVSGHDGEEIVDWNPNYDDSGNQVVALYGDTAIGLPAVSVLDLPEHASDLTKSWQITALPDTTEILDIHIGGDLVGVTGKCYLAGGEYRCRTPAVQNSALHFAMVDRNDVLGLFGAYGLSRTKLEDLTAFTGGSFSDVAVGQYVVGATSGSTSKILAKGADYLEIEFHEVGLTDGEDIVFLDSDSIATGVGCTLGDWVEGDVLEIQRSVQDEWIEGMDMRTFRPGGSKEVPEGLYFRVLVYNADTVDSLRIKVSLLVARA